MKPPTVRATSLAQQAAIPDHELRAGEDIVDNPRPTDEATVTGHFDGTCTHVLATFWKLWDDTDEGAL